MGRQAPGALGPARPLLARPRPVSAPTERLLEQPGPASATSSESDRAASTNCAGGRQAVLDMDCHFRLAPMPRL
eukprot:6629176-Pyramimonas_sp.AAC.1